MKEEINIRLDALIENLDNSELIKKTEKVSKKILENQELLSMIEKLKTLDIYSDEYKEIKRKLFENQDFVEYKQLENELNYFILEINQRLNKLVDKKECL